VNKDILGFAMRLLARREYSVAELQNRLVARSGSVAEVNEVIAELQRQGSVSDQRYAECYLRSRIDRGDGPVKLQAALRQKGVPESVIRHSMAESTGEDWRDRLESLRNKRFGKQPPVDPAEWARQARFLQGRGYTVEQIHRVIPPPWGH